MWRVQIRDQTTHSVQSDLWSTLSTKAPCFVISKEKSQSSLVYQHYTLQDMQSDLWLTLAAHLLHVARTMLKLQYLGWFY